MKGLRTIHSTFALAALIGVLVMTAGIPRVLAQSSGNFRLENNLTDTFGGDATSTSFSSVQSGGQTVSGEASSTNFVMYMGSMYFDAFAPVSQNWRWYSDEENETPTTALAAENVAPINIEDQSMLKLRLTVAETGGTGSGNAKLRLQYSTSSDFSSGGYDVMEAWQCSGGSGWCYANGGGTDGAAISTGLLSDADACSGGIGAGCGTHNESGTTTSAVDHAGGAAAEYEFTIQQSGANVNTVYFFRVVDANSSTTVPLNTGETYPSLVTGGSTLTFTIDGLSSGTVTEGQTTGVDTTPTSIPFGSLALDTSVAAAQRLTISTNGTQGYKVYAFQRQDFLANNGAVIDPVSGTNESPLGWTTGCASGAAGCYGYHSGEDVLEGGSTRFAANDTYAPLIDEPREVAYNNGPTNNKATDIVYRVHVRGGQESGAYTTNVVYIATPVF